MGVRIAMDDFGTGYSSLSHLSRLPLDELKIDRSFLRHLALDTHEWAIVRSIVDLAHNLNLTVVAEGVENPVVLPILKQLNCELAQGYYLGVPMPAERLTPYLVARCLPSDRPQRLAS
jgi:EAL domain-containing protein (putative c-di-GMP-specific phosphodiesterase class I)